MIKKEELTKLQKRTGLLLSTIEKDYVLGLLIWSFTQNRNLSTQWIFKGGTCLKKCYFKDYLYRLTSMGAISHMHEKVKLWFNNLLLQTLASRYMWW
jgi:hypothetical protein